MKDASVVNEHFLQCHRDLIEKKMNAALDAYKARKPAAGAPKKEAAPVIDLSNDEEKDDDDDEDDDEEEDIAVEKEEEEEEGVSASGSESQHDDSDSDEEM
jgi:hypothetical protein